MENTSPIRVAVTHGDVNGVGYELIFKTFGDPAMLELCVPIIYGSAKTAAYHRKALDVATMFTPITSAENAEAGKLNLVTCFEEEVNIEFGKPSQEAGKAAFLALERAVEDMKKGLVDVIVTAPINKASIQCGDFNFVGQTEYLQDRLGNEDEEALMILANSSIRVALVTTHLPLKDVAAAITQEAVEKKIRLFYRSLRRDFLLPAPRIAVLSLNPHCGEGGLLGKEEEESICPAVKALSEQGIPCFGPYAADGFFGSGAYRHFDGVLAMYHDQGLAPFKALSMNDGVNFTAGLSAVRTSPDHGTAYDITGKGVADESSFRQAVYMAMDVFRNRLQDDEAHQNPLQKQYHERREDGDRQRHMQGQRKPQEKTEE